MLLDISTLDVLPPSLAPSPPAITSTLAPPPPPREPLARPVISLTPARMEEPGADFLDLRFEMAGMARVIGDIAARSPAAPFAYVVTPNVDHLVQLHNTRSDLWPAFRHAWRTLCDSRILGRLAGMAGLHMPIVPGSDLADTMFRQVIRCDDRIAILGGSDAAIETLRRRYGLTDIVHYNPPMGFINDEPEVARAIEFLAGAHARYSILAVGSPQQEIVAYRVARLGTATGIGLCVGAGLDFLTGGQKRAPRMVQRLSLEWLYRLLSNPVRLWRRYLVDGPLIFQVYHGWKRRQFA